MTNAPVVVIGGGLAGMAAAWVLRRQGLPVVLLEARRQCGGRAGSFTDPKSGDEIDYCQHVAMGCCTQLNHWLEQLNLAAQWTRYDELKFFFPERPAADLKASAWLPAPLHLAASLTAMPFLSEAQRREVRRGVWTLMRQPSQGRETQTMGQWLRAHGQSDETIGAFWDVFLTSALGEYAEHVSYSAARKVFVDGFLAARGSSDVLVPRIPLSQMFGNQAAQQLRRAGVDLQTQTAVKRIEFAGDAVWAVVADENLFPASQIVIATPWFALQRLLAATPAAAAIPDFAAICGIPSSPITGIHLWFDRAITSRPHSVFVGGLAQWLFRPEVAGNGSSTGQPAEHYFQVVVSASRSLREPSGPQVIAKVCDELQMHFPAARHAKLLRHRVVTDPRAVFSVRPDVEAIRPAHATSHPQVFLAGDYTATDWPATMEGAVRSGWHAANAVLAARGQGTVALQPEPAPGWLARMLIRP